MLMLNCTLRKFTDSFSSGRLPGLPLPRARADLTIHVLQKRFPDMCKVQDIEKTQFVTGQQVDGSDHALKMPPSSSQFRHAFEELQWLLSRDAGRCKELRLECLHASWRRGQI